MPSPPCASARFAASDSEVPVANLSKRKSAALVPCMKEETAGTDQVPHQFSRELRRDEARSCDVLRAGAPAALHQLSYRSPFLTNDRARHLCRMAERDPAPGQRLALSPRAVLPVDVLVLRLSHHGGAARPADRGV